MMDIATSLSLEAFEPGVFVFRAGDAADAAYVIESGAVEVLLERAGEPQRINLLGAGALFGEIALLDGKPRTASVRAVEPTRLVRIQRSHLDSLLGRSDPVVQYLVTVLLDHVRRALGGHAAQEPAPAPASGPAPSDAQALRSMTFRTLSLAQGLSEALAGDQMELHYQPILAFDGGRLAGYEALVRWRHPALGMIRPDEFIPLAEKTDLIHRIGDFVLSRAITDWPALRVLCAQDGDHACFMSVNLSAPELCQPGLAERVESLLQARGMRPEELRIELTETVVIGNVAAVSAVVERLRAMGVGVALDDFGKGYAGLDVLQLLPFSCLKIDKAFVDRMHVSERSNLIIRSTLDLARRLGMSTVAEGIEDQATGDALAAMGCVYAQGYHYGRPQPASALPGWKAGRVR